MSWSLPSWLLRNSGKEPTAVPSVQVAEPTVNPTRPGVQPRPGPYVTWSPSSLSLTVLLPSFVFYHLIPFYSSISFFNILAVTP